MKKYRFFIYSIIVILLISLGAVADATIDNGSFTDDNGKTFSYSYNKSNNNLHIGGKGAINLYVSSDSSQLPWHQWCSEIKSISADNGIIQLGKGMFRGCTALTSVNLPGTILYIQPEAFAGCTALTEATFGEGLLTLADRVFADCTSLTKLNLPSTVVGLGNEFISGTAIKDLILSDKVSVLLPKKNGAPGSTFKGCPKDMTVRTMQTSYAQEWFANPDLNINNISYVVYKPSGTFSDKEGNADSIRWEVDIAEKTLTISDIAGVGTANMPDYEEAKYTPWYGQYGKYKTVFFSSGITRVGSRTFQSDNITQKVYIPATVTAYGTYVFNGTGAVTDIVFEEGTKSLNFGTIINNNNGSLKQLTIPKSVTKIHDNFFINPQNKDRVKELTLNVYKNTAGHQWALKLQGRNDIIQINFLD